jgi:hypothetical protein
MSSKGLKVTFGEAEASSNQITRALLGSDKVDSETKNKTQFVLGQSVDVRIWKVLSVYRVQRELRSGLGQNLPGADRP